VRTFNAQGLAITVWAFGKAGERAPALFAAIAVQAEQRVRTFNAQELANTVWAFAMAGERAPALFAAIAAHAEQHMHTFNAQDLANMAWAFAAAFLINVPLAPAAECPPATQGGEQQPQLLFSVISLAERYLADTSPSCTVPPTCPSRRRTRSSLRCSSATPRCADSARR
jgi:hypothetical protein